MSTEGAPVNLTHPISLRRSVLKLTAAGVAASAAGAFALPMRNGDKSRVAGAKLDVRMFGATGNGTSLDTAAINKAIEAAAESGGGTVHFPAGVYLSYSIHLKTNVVLSLDPGSTILAA